MASVNKVILIGRLGKDPEMKYTPSGTPVCKFSIATNESYKDKSGVKQETTEWHSIVTWNKTAEICNKYLKKGSECYIDGKITTRSWDDKDGNKHYKTEIVANNVQFIGSKKEEKDYSVPDNNHAGLPMYGESNNPPPTDENLPF